MRKNNKCFSRRGIALLLSLFIIFTMGAGFTSAAEPADIDMSETAEAGGTEASAAGSEATNAAADEAEDPTDDEAANAAADAAEDSECSEAAANGMVSYSLAPSSEYDYSDILNTWRTGGKSLKSLLQGSTGSGTQIGGIQLSYKTIPLDYNFSLGGDMSGKTLKLSRGAIDGTEYENQHYKRDRSDGDDVDIPQDRLAGQGLTTSWFYDLETDDYDTPSCTYPSVGTYTDPSGRVHEVDVRLTLISYGKNEYHDGASYAETDSEYSINKTMLFGFRMKQVGVACLGLDYMEIRYDFFEHGTENPVEVKGNTTFTDIDYAQGILIADGTCDSLLINPSGEYPVAESVYGSAVNGGVYIYDDYTTAQSSYPGGGHVYNPNGSGDGYSRSAAYTELFSGSSLTRTYTFVREDGRRARGAIDNETDPVVMKEDGLIIEKKISGDTEASPDEFRFTVYIEDSSHHPISSGEFGDVAVKDGYGYLYIGINGQKKITGLQPGYTVRITENTDPSYTPSITADGKPVSGNTYTYVATGYGKLIQVTVDNTIKDLNRKLAIRKEVAGAVDVEREFRFDVTIWDDEGEEVPAGTYGDLTVGQDGKGQITLKHNESKTIEGIKTGYKVRIDEQTDPSYETTVNGNKTGTYEYTFSESSGDKTHTVTFVNTINTTDFLFTKVKSEDYQAGLEGAEFRLYKLICTDKAHDHDALVDTEDPGSCWEWTATETSDPKVTFTDLLPGEYRLAETKAPDGRLLPEGQWKIVVGRDLTVTCNDTAGDSLPPAFFMENGLWVLPNVPPLDIPSSGGSGTDGFLLLGILFMGGGILFGFTVWKGHGRTRGGAHMNGAFPGLHKSKILKERRR